MAKITHAEHSLRAQLMGRVYDWRDGTYCEDNDGIPSGYNMIDAMTLNPVGVIEVERRKWVRMGVSWSKAEHDTPYGTME